MNYFPNRVSAIFHFSLFTFHSSLFTLHFSLINMLFSKGGLHYPASPSQGDKRGSYT